MDYIKLNILRTKKKDSTCVESFFKAQQQQWHSHCARNMSFYLASSFVVTGVKFEPIDCQRLRAAPRLIFQTYAVEATD